MKIIGLGLLMLFSTSSFAATGNDQQVIASKDALVSYLAVPEDCDTSPHLQQQRFDAEHQVQIETYTFSSQTWPKASMSSHSTVWQHALIVYIPKVITTSQALLYVNGGTRNAMPQLDNPPPHVIDFSIMAAATGSIVVDLQDVPNQYLVFDDGIPRKEDSILAYSWGRFLHKPADSAYWPGHVPMAKAIIKAMNAVQYIAQNNHQIDVANFMVVGTSKRGLATWLAALVDERINAIIPIAIDILNTKDNLKYIYASYDNHWPPVFQSYLEEKIPEYLDTPEFAELMNIEDPVSYLSGKNAAAFKQRLSIPKLIISASGDDFFVPDSLSVYLTKIPGETNVRMLPNQSHYLDLKKLEMGVLAFYQSIISHSPRPVLQWQVSAAGDLQGITTDTQPDQVILWQATNPDRRDFRLAEGIHYLPQILTAKSEDKSITYSVSARAATTGWQASFIEVTYPNSMVMTTPVFITSTAALRKP
jgi:PhoPQ-activated pathogenicity-related protein